MKINSKMDTESETMALSGPRQSLEDFPMHSSGVCGGTRGLYAPPIARYTFPSGSVFISSCGKFSALRQCRQKPFSQEFCQDNSPKALYLGKCAKGPGGSPEPINNPTRAWISCDTQGRACCFLSSGIKKK